jgi:hypothetical protein
MASERLLVNFFYAYPVGHAVEALYRCHGYHAADPSREVSVVLNAETPVRLADFCPFVTAAYAVEHPFVDACPDSLSRLVGVPRRWDWVLDDARRKRDLDLGMFSGMRNYYAASDEHLVASRGRSVAGVEPPSYVRHRQLRFELPEAARAAAARRMPEGGPWIAVMPAGSGERALYPSAASWSTVLDALGDALPAARFALLGKLEGSHVSSRSSIGADDVGQLLSHLTQPVDCLDLDLAEQLAVADACDLFVSPHTGFAFAALAVGTPWLTISGGHWFEYFFNRVPFRSVMPDTDRYPCFTRFGPLPVIDDGPDGPRTPSMSRARILDDLDAITAAAVELVEDCVTYEQALADYFADLLRALRGDASSIFSIDDVHADYIEPDRNLTEVTCVSCRSC